MTNFEIWQLIFSGVLGLIGTVSLVQIVQKIRKFKPQGVDTHYIDLKEAPSLTVCIPVRNEDHAIQDCLERVLSSNYPKMEVIVLDDDSVDQTPEVVKIFARDGVRFIKGNPLPEGWIGKNKAMDQLLEEANGKYILFLSADTDIKPDSISRLVSFTIKHEAEMVGVAPIREDGWRLSAIFSSLRLFWTLLFDTKAAPAYMSSAWLVGRQSLVAAGGFNEYRLAINPERELANYFANRGSYRFLLSNYELGFTYEKRWLSQIDTNIRTLWPMVQKNYYLPIFFLGFTLLSWLVLGLAVFSEQWSDFSWGLILANLWLTISLTVCNYRSRNYTGWLTPVVWPVVMIQEIASLTISYFKHRFNKLVWKGRTLTDHID